MSESGAGGPLRIAHVTLGRCNPDSANGIDKMVYQLSRAQADLGHTVAVFSMSPKPPLPIPGAEMRTYGPVVAPRWLGHGYLADLLVVRSPVNVPWRLLRELAAWEPDIVHLHSLYVPQNITIGLWLSRRRIPYCITIHGQLGPTKRAFLHRSYKQLASRLLLDRAGLVHAISEQDHEGAREYRVKSPVLVVPNGIDLESVELASGSAPEPPPRNGGRTFLFLGRMDLHQKGLDLLLDAFARARVPHAALVLVGPDWRGDRERLEAQAERLGLSGRVSFVGPAFGARKIAFLHGADVFVHTSRWEGGVPYAVLEAAAVGRPCLLCAKADPTGSLTGGGAGILVAPEVESIAGGIHRLATAESETLADMGRRAREIIKAEFSWPRIAQTIVDGYRACLPRPKP